MDTALQAEESGIACSTGNTPIHGTGASPYSRPGSFSRWSNVSSTGINYSPSHAQAQDKQLESDFRAKEPRQTWTEQNWDETRRARWKKSYEYEEPVTGITSYLQEYIKNWQECDVNTVTGELLPPVEYPLTKSGHDEDGMITSEMRHQSYCRKPPKKGRRARRRAKKAAQKAAQKAAIAEPLVNEPPLELQPNIDDVLIPCHIRPVQESDMEGVAEVYNNEVKNGYKVMDVNPVSVEDFQALILACQHDKMPFIVALEGWHPPHKDANPRLIGFALVDAVSRGITGSRFTRSCHGGKITVIVHPDFRRKRIGSALIDIILSSCSRTYFPKLGYQFLNPNQDHTFMRPVYNGRQWHYLEMDVIVRSGESEEETRKGEEFQWIWNYLEERYLLILVNYGVKMLKNPDTEPVQYLDKLTFRHLCRHPKDF
ncbi:hypothetical protein F4775DRAFT_7627 [Biscogniauxia sp. FL1348]|nr:hypothetical protein F4775DRAFT_7627 [Biscogniauxia sp. FL1348]